MSYPAFQKVGKKLLPTPLLQHATESANSRNKQFQILLEQRKWPEEGWDEQTIEIFLNELSAMDTNNFMTRPSGVGEREGRTYSSLVRRRAYGLSHGIGRSGDLAESQPKAAGSSLMSSLTNDLLLDFLQTNIGKDVKEACLFPMATGMTMTLILLTLAKLKPGAKHVVWLRHDQKSVFKSILTAGLTPIIVDPVLSHDKIQLETNVEGVESAISRIGRDNILCIITTTSCFAPRSCDNLKSLRKFCFGSRVHHDNCESTKCSRHFGGDQDSCGTNVIYHVVNNAYGMQSRLILGELRKAMSHVDLFIQSTDKNLLVPVGGCIVGSPIISSPKNSVSLLTKVRKNYPGRASSYPASDVLITILSMGKKGFKSLVEQREENYKYMKTKLTEVSKKHNEQALSLSGNDISIGFSLGSVGPSQDVLTSVGGMLFKRNVTGARVVTTEDVKTIDGYTFKGWGAHHPEYPVPYLTAAAAIGMDKEEIDDFIGKLDECIGQVKSQDKLVKIGVTETNNNALL
ncbi:O-phosphoseryl-tRNA(Sec) selenium transferase [Orchesella cincta]|uniref:O-phosphoseryl-tRNA(Sec) selenium transferase n=1 Tax=Orchesella cincta TaxID=48709 RepID=A0A1D2N471_ORCCI|nr:O-phosphoseryl-tRNA(Sec) selenium transferase [Orchesella cincta]